MPTTYTHYKFGTEVIKALPEPIKARAERHRELYDIGQHGPDILFYYKALKKNPVASQGSSLHRQNADVFFSRAAEIIRREENQDAARAYLYGFVCHFVLDSECHPYVEKMIHESGVGHNEIEMELDRYLLSGDGFDPVSHVQTSHVRPTEENARVIAPFFYDLSVETVHKALRSMIFYHNLFRAPGKGKRTVLFAAMRLVGKYEDLHGIVMSLTPNPACREYCLILKKKYDQAVPLAAELIAELERVLDEGGELPERFCRDFEAGENWESLRLEL
ncbi:MAG: zinc dependent phospholipase C family protein [Lachnospiraceae bacterium]|nr:zinc dependent phospholipase C family protein [Lachnospiraceae bacterium]